MGIKKLCKKAKKYGTPGGLAKSMGVSKNVAAVLDSCAPTLPGTTAPEVQPVKSLVCLVKKPTDPIRHTKDNFWRWSEGIKKDIKMFEGKIQAPANAVCPKIVRRINEMDMLLVCELIGAKRKINRRINKARTETIANAQKRINAVRDADKAEAARIVQEEVMKLMPEEAISVADKEDISKALALLVLALEECKVGDDFFIQEIIALGPDHRVYKEFMRHCPADIAKMYSERNDNHRSEKPAVDHRDHDETLKAETARGNYQHTLTQQDIGLIARFKYNYVSGHDHDDSEASIEVISEGEVLNRQLTNYFSDVNSGLETRPGIFIINLGETDDGKFLGLHWVCLVVTPTRTAFFQDSLGSPTPSFVSNALREHRCATATCFPGRQQLDGYNCGLFAIKNAHKIIEYIKGRMRINELQSYFNSVATQRELRNDRIHFSSLIPQHEYVQVEPIPAQNNQKQANPGMTFFNQKEKKCQPSTSQMDMSNKGNTL